MDLKEKKPKEEWVLECLRLSRIERWENKWKYEWKIEFSNSSKESFVCDLDYDATVEYLKIIAKTVELSASRLWNSISESLRDITKD